MTEKNKKLIKREQEALEVLQRGPIRCIGRRGEHRYQFTRGKQMRLKINMAALNGLVKKGWAHHEHYFSDMRVTQNNPVTGMVQMTSFEIREYWLDGQKLPEF